MPFLDMRQERVKETHKGTALDPTAPPRCATCKARVEMMCAENFVADKTGLRLWQQKCTIKV